MDLMTLLTRLLAFSMANVRELVFLVGLALLAGGLALVSIPAALIVPGSLLVWLAIPPREKKT
jgi:hypothetical protein